MSEPLGLRIYRLLTSAAEPLSGLLFAQRLKRGRENPERVNERRGTASVARPQGPLVWLHGASVGELMSVLPLISHLHARGLSLLVTSGTVTSSQLAEERLPDGVVHQFVPFDVPAYARRFLEHWKPQLALFVESDLWPNLLQETAARGVPMVLVNARLSERSFRRWQRFPNIIAHVLRRFALALARTPLDAERLSALRAERVLITGDLKLDVPAPPANADALAELKQAIGERPLLAASSTHSGEDEQVRSRIANCAAHIPACSPSSRLVIRNAGRRSPIWRARWAARRACARRAPCRPRTQTSTSPTRWANWVCSIVWCRSCSSVAH